VVHIEEQPYMDTLCSLALVCLELEEIPMGVWILILFMSLLGKHFNILFWPIPLERNVRSIGQMYLLLSSKMVSKTHGYKFKLPLWQLYGNYEAYLYIHGVFLWHIKIRVVKLIYESIESVLFLDLQVQGGEQFRLAFP